MGLSPAASAGKQVCPRTDRADEDERCTGTHILDLGEELQHAVRGGLRPLIGRERRLNHPWGIFPERSPDGLIGGCWAPNSRGCRPHRIDLVGWRRALETGEVPVELRPVPVQKGEV